MNLTSLLGAVVPLLLLTDLSLSQTELLPDTSSIPVNAADRRLTPAVMSWGRDALRSFPYRSVNEVLRLSPRVAQHTDGLHARGGRTGELRYLLDGTSIFNPWNNQPTVPILHDAVESIVLMPGIPAPDLPSGTSGTLDFRSRTASEAMHFSVEFRTDDFASGGAQFLGTTSRGVQDLTLTAGGSIRDDLHMFVAANHTNQRNKQAIVLEPFKFEGLLCIQSIGGQYAGTALPGPIGLQRNSLDQNWSRSDQGHAAISYDIADDITLRMIGTYRRVRQKENDWPTYLDNIFRLDRVPETETRAYHAGLRFLHCIDEISSYEVGVSVQNRFARTYDPSFGDDWRLYVDSAENAGKGYTGFWGRWDGPLPYVIITDFRLNHEHAPNNSYSKDEQQAIGGTFHFGTRLLPMLELKAGGSFEFWTMRKWTIKNIAGFMRRQYGTRGNAPAAWPSAADSLRILAGSSGGNIDYYGYRLTGEEGEDIDPAKLPSTLSGYVQTWYETEDMILDAGVRIERYDLDLRAPENPLDISSYVTPMQLIDIAALKHVRPFTFVHPRIGMLLLLPDQTSFGLRYGTYSQMPALQYIYAGTVYASRTVAYGIMDAPPYGAFAQPERTSQVEATVEQDLGDRGRVALTGYIKRTDHLLGVRKVSTELNDLYPQWANEEVAEMRGIELEANLRLHDELRIRLAHAWSSAKSTASNPSSNFGLLERGSRVVLPELPVTADFSRTHVGSIILDYSSPLGSESSILEGFRACAIFRYSSGVPYTRIAPFTASGAAGTFEFGTQPIADPRWAVPLEATNSSRGPWNTTLDLRVSQEMDLGPVVLVLFVDVLNVLDTRNVTNVFPMTGAPNDDAWFSHPYFLVGYKDIPFYESFYRAVNLNNRHALLRAGVADTYGPPRELRFGIRVEM